jgi:predicted sugar kinase
LFELSWDIPRTNNYLGRSGTVPRATALALTMFEIGGLVPVGGSREEIRPPLDNVPLAEAEELSPYFLILVAFIQNFDTYERRAAFSATQRRGTNFLHP